MVLSAGRNAAIELRDPPPIWEGCPLESYNRAEWGLDYFDVCYRVSQADHAVDEAVSPNWPANLSACSAGLYLAA